MDLVVIVDCDSASPNCRHLSLHYSFSSSFSCFFDILVYGPGIFRQIFFRVGFQSSVSLGFNRLVIPGDQRKRLREVMTACLLHRCKHL